MLNSARFNPINRTVRPCMDTVIYPNTCSIRHLVFDLTRLLSFCSFVSAFPRKPFSQTLFSICSGSSLPIYALSQSENRPLIANLREGSSRKRHNCQKFSNAIIYLSDFLTGITIYYFIIQVHELDYSLWMRHKIFF